MITTSAEYNEKLWLIQHNNMPRKAILPESEHIYNIDLKTRKIESPEFLSVQKDHSAESIYFSVPRYLDYMDLAETACVIQYKTGLSADGGPFLGLYRVPFYDITTYNEPGNERIIFPWLLSGEATALSGPVEYSIKFFNIQNVSNDPDKKVFKYLYNLNTLPATSVVLYGMDVQAEDLDGKFDIDPSFADTLLSAISELSKHDIYWIEMK